MKNTFFPCLTKVLLAGLLLWFPAAARAVVVLDSVPFELGPDHRVYVECRINGHARPLRFLLDTGATDVVLNSASPHTGGLAQFGERRTNRGANSVEHVAATAPTQRLQLGRLTADSLALLSIAYPPQAWDGVLGLSFLRRYVVRLDYPRRLLFFYDPATFRAPDGQAPQALTYRLGVPVATFRLEYAGQPYEVSLELDTGSDRVLDLNTPFVRRHGLRGRKQPFALSQISGTTRDGGVLENVFFDALHVAGFRLPGIPGALSAVTEGVQASSELDGVMGSNLLYRFNQTYDFGRGRLYLEPNRYLYTPFYDFLAQ